MKRERNQRYTAKHPESIAERFQRLYWANGGDNDFRRKWLKYDRDRYHAMSDEEKSDVLRRMRNRRRRLQAFARANKRKYLAAEGKARLYDFRSGIEDDDIALTREEVMAERYG